MYDQWWAFKGFQMTLVCRSCSDENFINITCTKNSWNTLTLIEANPQKSINYNYLWPKCKSKQSCYHFQNDNDYHDNHVLKKDKRKKSKLTVAHVYAKVNPITSMISNHHCGVQVHNVEEARKKWKCSWKPTPLTCMQMYPPS